MKWISNGLPGAVGGQVGAAEPEKGTGRHSTTERASERVGEMAGDA